MSQELNTFMRLRGMTITELAQASHVKRAYVSHLVHGDRKNPSPKIVNKLAKALNVLPEELFPSLYAS